MDKNNLSINRLQQLLKWNNLKPISPLNDFTESFYVSTKVNNEYVEPFLSVRRGDIEQLPDIVLITAAGAVGKTELTNFLSCTNRVPIFDLAINKPVGDYAMTGVLSDIYDFSALKEAIKEGTNAVIVDALDEGEMKTRDEAFFSFIDNIATLVPKETKATPFILMGRTNIMNRVYEYLDGGNTTIWLLQIEPFTIEQAKKFLYNQVIGDDKQKYTPSYIEIQDYIIATIESFFKSQGEFTTSTYQNFIGYAPVLQAIGKLLQKNPNYQRLLNSLRESQATNVDLLVKLMEDILYREQSKVRENLINVISASYPDDIKEEIQQCYSIEEQCLRLLSRCLNYSDSFCEVSDPSFRNEYEKGIQSFMKEHPFWGASGFGNVVFESFALATIATSTKKENRLFAEMYRDLLLKNSFAYYPIMNAVIKKQKVIISASYFPSLYSSLISQSQSMLQTEVDLEESGDTPSNLKVSFYNDDQNLDDEITLEYQSKDGPFNLGSYIGNASISGSFSVILDNNSTVLRSPISLICSEFICKSGEIILNCMSQDEKCITIDCNKLVVAVTDDIPKLRNNGCELIIYSEAHVSHPFASYKRNEPISKQDPNYEKYHKLRAIISQFRAHKKGGDWAKKKDKLDRRYSQGVGGDTLKALIENNILYEEKHLYKLNQTKMREILELTYTEMLNSQINEKVTTFLTSY